MALATPAAHDDSVLAFQFDREHLSMQTEALKQAWDSASPFPHIVVDNMLPPELLDSIIAEFPEPEDMDWQRLSGSTEIKLTIADTTQMGAATRHLLNELNGQVFVEFLENVTGIKGLIPDPHLWGGGLHQIRRGGYLKIHADFNRHRRLKLDRRLNALIYLNKDWSESYKGQLELWDRTMTSCDQRILPLFNRLVVFATTDFTYHGHPDPLECPANRARRSLALYYYSNGRPANEITSDHTTLFRKRPGESYKIGRTWKDVVRRWTPPAITDLIRK
jgi:Rps23 Pro-64 3,4-dihydroxylase Tpa1-like proline 4-hydroxylase